VVRDVHAGCIEVFLDDTTTHMTAMDTTFTEGCIGVGTSDDSGYVDDISFWGNPAQRIRPGDDPGNGKSGEGRRKRRGAWKK